MNDGLLLGLPRETVILPVGVGVKLITTSQAWVCPPGVYTVDFELISGGGGSAGTVLTGCLNFAYYSPGSNGGTSSAFGFTVTGGNGYNNSPAASITAPADNTEYMTAYGFLWGVGYGNGGSAVPQVPGTDGTAGYAVVGRARVVPGVSYQINIGGGGAGGPSGGYAAGNAGAQGAARLRW